MKKFLSLALCLAMLFSCFAYAAPATEYAESAAEVTESALPEETAAAELTAELPDGVSATDPDYGTLIVCENFESLGVDSYLLNGSATKQYPIPQWINSEFFGSLGSRICFDESTGFNSSAVAQILSDGSNKYLKVYNGTTTGSAVTLLRFQNVNSPDGWTRDQPLTAKGTYTVVADYKLPDDGGEAVTSIRNRIFYNFISGSGDKSAETSVDVKTKLTTDKWYTNTVQLTLDGTTVQKITSFGVQSNSTCADTNASGVLQSAVCIDNIKIYYKPYPTITFDANGVEATVPAAETGETFNLNADTYKPTGYDDTKYLFRGWTETPDGEAMYTTAYAPTESKTLYAKWVPLYDDTYGELLVFDDFQKKNIGTNIVNWGVDYVKFERAKNDQGQDIQPAFGSDNNSTAVVTDVNGNKMAKVTRSGTNQTMSIFLVNMRQVTDAAIADPNAIYTALADFYVPGSEDPKFTELRVSIGNGYTHDTSGGGKRAFSSATDTDKVITRFASLHGFNSNASSNNKVHLVYFLDNTPSGVTVTDVENFSYYIDNIRIYKLDVANVTFDANGESATVPASVAVGSGNDLILKSYAPSNYSATRAFKGWSLTPDGEVLSGSLKITSDITLYAIFGDAQLHPGYSVTFNNSEAFSKYFNNPGSSAVGPIPGGDVYNAYVSDENGGFQRFTFKSKEGATNFYVGDPKMEAKNFATPLYTKNIKGVSIKYRFNTIPEAIKGTSDSMSVYLKLNDPAAYKTDETLTYPDITQRTCVFSNSITLADNDWHTAYIDFAGSTNYAINGVSYKWTDFDRMQNFRFDILNNGYDGLVMDVAGIDFVLSDDVTLDVNKAPVLTSANGADAADYRDGVLNVTYESDPGYTADEFYAAAITDAAKVFSGTDNVEKIENTDGSVTYRMYAVKSLIGQTVYVKSALKEEFGSITGSLGTAVEYTRKAFDDGENIIPNGDFSNKFYNIWNTADNGSATIENGSLKVVIGTNGNQWIALKASNIMFKPDTKYFYKISIIYDDTEDFKYPFKGVSGLSVYVPFQDGLFDGSKAAFNKQNGKLVLGGGTEGQFLGTTQTVNGVVTIMNENYYSNIARRNNSTSYTDGSKTASSLEALGAITGKTYNTNYFYERAQSWTGTYDKLFKTGADLSLLTAFDKKQFVGDDGAWDSKNSPAAGLTYNLKEYVIKEMWSVNLDANGADGDLETVYLAKDETITLPTTTGYTKAGYAFGGWMVNGEKATTVTATQFKQNVNITAVWNPAYDAPVSYANETTIRTKNPAGLRFIASVADDVANDDSVEYGFIVTRKVLLDAAKIDEADFTHNSAVKKTSGISHDKTTHLTFRNADNNTFFAAALVGIKAANYKDTLLVRPYFKSADGIYYYGVPMSASIYDVAKTVSESAEFASYTDEMKAVVNAILNGSELPTA